MNNARKAPIDNLKASMKAVASLVPDCAFDVLEEITKGTADYIKSVGASQSVNDGMDKIGLVERDLLRSCLKSIDGSDELFDEDFMSDSVKAMMMSAMNMIMGASSASYVAAMISDDSLQTISQLSNKGPFPDMDAPQLSEFMDAIGDAHDLALGLTVSISIMIMVSYLAGISDVIRNQEKRLFDGVFNND